MITLLVSSTSTSTRLVLVLVPVLVLPLVLASVSHPTRDWQLVSAGIQALGFGFESRLWGLALNRGLQEISKFERWRTGFRLNIWEGRRN